MSEVEKLKQQIERLQKTNLVLMEKVEQTTAERKNDFSLFENNTLLKKQVSNKTKDLEEALSDLRKQQAITIHQAKLSSLGEMSVGIAHEIKKPLAVLKALVRKLQRLEENTVMSRDEINGLIFGSLTSMDENTKSNDYNCRQLKTFRASPRSS